MAEAAGKVKIVGAEKRGLQATTGGKMGDTAAGMKMIHISYAAMGEKSFPFTKKDTVKVEDGDKVKAGQTLVVYANGEEAVAEVKGTVKLGKKEVVLTYEAQAVAEHEIPAGYHIIVKDGDEVQAGDSLTEGQLDLQDLFRHKGQDAVMQYILKEVLAVYLSQGQKLSSKHVELIIRQMFSRVYVREAGDTDLLPGQVIEKTRAEAEMERAQKASKMGEAVLEPLFMGITKVALSTESFLSAASFMETARVLINAAVTGKVDSLEGLKENVIIGRLSPTGTGFEGHQFNELAEENR